MERKINGYARDNYGVIEFVELGEPEEGTWHEATLVVGKERVFTEGEVRAMLRDLIENQALCDVHNGWQSGMIPDFAGIASKHGVSLDPA